MLGELVSRFRGVKPPRFPSVFEALVNAAKVTPQPVPVAQAVGQSAGDVSSRSKRPAKRPAARR